MIDFEETNGNVRLIYEAETSSNEWVYERLEEQGQVTLKNTYHFTRDNLLSARDSSDEGKYKPVEFLVAQKENEYYKFIPEVLGIDFALYIHQDVKLTPRIFTAPRKISIFSRIKRLKLVDKEIYIGGTKPNNIPAKEFMKLIKSLPTEYELSKYVSARVCSVIKNYFEVDNDEENKFQKYMDAKGTKVGEPLRSRIKEYEVSKYQIIHTKLQSMLDDENSYNEAQWQREILEIILLIFPKYIQAFTEVPVKDTYNNKTRKLDFLLVDSTGNTDIIEIKKPFDSSIVTNTLYRDNHIPLRELSGTVMQIEKYIFYLNKWGKKGEEILTQKYSNKLPQDFHIKITNPRGIIIMGRNNNLTKAQLQDFEVIKRKYTNVVDIITYDDLISRILVTVAQLQSST